MKITISGPPGSGKTTVCYRLSELLDIECVISGNLFREMASDYGLTLEEFGELAKSDPRYDMMLDQRILEIARESDDIILEGRLAAHMLTRSQIPAFRVLLDSRLGTRADRVAEREAITSDEARRAILTREECEARRYLEYYGIDIRDLSVYDLILDTSDVSAEEVADIILTRMGGDE